MSELSTPDSEPSFCVWIIRKELPDGMMTCIRYSYHIPVTAEAVRNSPCVKQWLGSDKIDEIYHPVGNL